MNRFFRTLGLGVFWMTGIPAVARQIVTARNGRFVIGFHGVSTRYHEDLPQSAQPILQLPEFTGILEWLAHRFRFLTPGEFFEGSEAGLLLTFDDGLANNHDLVLPVLERFGAPAVFFVATYHVENAPVPLAFIRKALADHGLAPESVERNRAREIFEGMGRDSVRRCADHPLITIGGHTVSHPRLTSLDDETLGGELVESRAFLEALINRQVDLFAYPFGDYDGRVIDAVRRAGYRAAFAEKSRGAGSVEYEIPRIGLYSSSRPYLSVKLSGSPVPWVTGAQH